MTSLLLQAFEKAQSLPEYLQDEFATQFLEDIESEMRWLQTLSQPQPSKLDQLATKALNNSLKGKTKILGFDQL
ncbi:hypothetical protein VB774_16365 [Pseudanabaena galeata UHCC 0370]|jgi:hypothetical protein|uniref:Uncharacterized protein n=1 Tax=Pseudanabaena galeata UHCC 0370 TaxID=3110310 RepID=A0ABU5TMD8_9CYAN|nr:hypothetical protein [Pseudanabaena galeata]MEA5479196.1 hypothetical protein [Pseudanabaena galeata UHCC 0370]